MKDVWLLRRVSNVELGVTGDIGLEEIRENF